MRQSLTQACWFIVFLSWTAVTANTDKPVYKAVGDKVVLTPKSVANPITSIMWKYGPDIAMEWYGGETEAYRHFKVRGTLNSSTGALTITELTRNDSGTYTVEINNQPITSMTELLVISPVSKPSVSTWCDPEMTYCVFTCEGNTTDAEPINYLWGASDMVLGYSTKVHNITKEEKEPLFRCMLDNPVSFKSSEEVLNPFTTGNQKWMLTCLILLVGVILLVCILFFIHKCKRRKGKDVEGTPQEGLAMLQHGQETPTQDPTCVVSPDTNNVTAISSISEVKETSTQDSTSPVSPDTSDETEVPETSDQDPTCVASPDTSDETERSSVISETPNQDPTCAVSPDTCKETENSAVMSSG